MTARRLTHGVETPPPSPGKRRRFLRSSEDTEGDMAIERYIYAADPFRAATYPVLFPFPVCAVPLEDQAIVISHHSELLQLLSAHGFSTEPEIVLQNITKPYYPGGDTGVKALRILYHTEQSTLGHFSSARDSVREFLIGRGYHDIHVEIVQRDFCFQPSVFAIEPQNWAVRVYERAKDALLPVIKDRLGSAWRLLSLFAVGRTEDRARPSVVVLVKPGTICDWATLEGAMREVIARNSPGFSHLDIEFLPGTLDEYMDPPPAEAVKRGHPQLDSITADGKMEMGFSIGRCGERGGGTAGGFVTLTQDGVTRKGILTNYHVVRPRSETPESATDSMEDSRGSSLLSADETRQQLQFFMAKDIEATREEVADHLRAWGDKLKGLQESRERNLMIDRRQPPSLLDQISSHEDFIRQLQFKEAVVQQMPKSLGKVVVSSGKLIYEKRIHDWAFVELSDATIARASQPNKIPAIPRAHEPSQYGTMYNRSLLGGGVNGFGRLSKGKYYFKQGRTTDVTGGMCNGVMATCNWTDRDSMRYDEFGQPAKIQKESTEEYVIICKQGRGEYYTQDEFSAPGDSGSFIIGEDGEVCGLLYGSMTGLCGPPGRKTYYVGAGLAMCMSDVTKSVNLRTVPRDANGQPTGAPAVLGLME